MQNRFSRTRLLLGETAMLLLSRARVAVFGVGGVGGYVVEALARSGVGALDIIDNDVVALSNLNRQIIALDSTVGEYKVDAAARRIKDINPLCRVTAYKTFYTPQTAGEFDLSLYDYVVDAVDTVTAKLELARRAQDCGTPIISCMGTGNKLDPTMLEVTDISKTSVCPLARVMRIECRKRGIKKLRVVYSKEPPLKYAPDCGETEQGGARRSVPGSTAFVPPAAGLIIAGEVVRHLTSHKESVK